MDRAKHLAAQALTKQAADWVARLSGQPAEADWLAFEAWLDGDDRRRGAYDRALALSLAVDREAERLGDRLTERPAGRRNAVLWGGGLAAALAVAATFAVLRPTPEREAKVQVYATAKGEQRNIVLSDGTRIALSTDTRLSVSMRADRRELTLASGEAAFQVKHDRARPFLVHLGDRVARDVGTEFDASRHDGLVSVTVREGLVALERAEDRRRRVSLGPGSRAEHREGSEEVAVTVANADDAFAWRTGRLIYRDRPLSEVAADINRYGEEQVKPIGPAADLRFTGVLTIDNQTAMVQRLAGLLPVAATSGKDGVILLSELNSTR